ncbi:biofilm formation/cell division transcriptional regulator BrpA [Streptococcus macacae]|uniref:Biofilm regulatory protein A n=1 Tax=Streptococcus macacae NCTC 11558 TaxID=764298 RepID=G5JXY3_9STRE|nr:LCP family protein [Streptococcus macacae]EHJ53367.1 biofilm regulatory protein A [Streptococcus macacae NCTC 11558]SUN77902.1 LytR family transcriptional regulator [Streptococcus macacae NCTC 11558]
MKIGKKILLMLGVILMTSIVAVGVYATSIYNFSLDEISKTFKDYGTGSSGDDAISKSKPFSILLMGVDTGSEERTSKWEGNSDSMILVTVNPKTKKTTMTSLERDVLIKLSGPKNNEQNGQDAKLNAAYAAGGAKMAIMTVQDMLDIKIDKYMQINMKGLQQLVDAVDGITVTNKFNFPISISEHEPEFKASVEPGTHKINGEQALVYSRMRYDDPDGDYGRQKRQREVISKVLKKILALDSVGKYRKILSAVSKNMQTNIEISSKTIPDLLGYRDALKEVKTYQLKGEAATIDGGSYQLLTSKEILKVQNRIKKQLGIKESDLENLKTTAMLYENYSGDTSVYDSSSSSASDYSSGNPAAGAYSGSGSTYGYDSNYGSSSNYNSGANAGTNSNYGGYSSQGSYQ